MQGWIEHIPNGNSLVKFEHYFCDKCRVHIPENHPHYTGNKCDYHLCWDCGFVDGYLTEKQYLSVVGINLSNAHAAIRDGEIIRWVGGKPPWEYKDSDHRNTPQYKEWRKSVFERDSYTCQKCNTRGGNLEAHHIKRFKDYKELRYVTGNGITYCVSCHRLEHRRGD